MSYSDSYGMHRSVHVVSKQSESFFSVRHDNVIDSDT